MLSHTLAVVVVLQCLLLQPLDARSVRTTGLSGCSGQYDVIFAIDASAHKELFQQKLEFVRNVTQGLSVGAGQIQVGVSTFHEENIAASFHLGDHNNLRDVLTAISNTPYDYDDKPDIPAALRHIRQEMLSSSHGRRPSVPAIVVFISDGDGATRHDVTGDVSTEAKLLQNVSTVLVVGVGDYIDQTVLQAISSPGSNVYIVHSPHNLAVVAGELLGHVCPGPSPTASPTTVHSPGLTMTDVDLCPAPLPRDKYLQYRSGRCYQFVVYRHWDFTTASGECRQAGGTLVVLQDGDVNQWVQHELHQTYGVHGEAWIGLQPPGLFTWQDGTAAEWTNWASGGGHHGGLDCAVIDTSSSGQWRICQCVTSSPVDSKPFVCQFMAATPSTTTSSTNSTTYFTKSSITTTTLSSTISTTDSPSTSSMTPSTTTSTTTSTTPSTTTTTTPTTTPSTTTTTTTTTTHSTTHSTTPTTTPTTTPSTTTTTTPSTTTSTTHSTTPTTTPPTTPSTTTTTTHSTTTSTTPSITPTTTPSTTTTTTPTTTPTTTTTTSPSTTSTIIPSTKPSTTSTMTPSAPSTTPSTTSSKTTSLTISSTPFTSTTSTTTSITSSSSTSLAVSSKSSTIMTATKPTSTKAPTTKAPTTKAPTTKSPTTKAPTRATTLTTPLSTIPPTTPLNILVCPPFSCNLDCGLDGYKTDAQQCSLCECDY